MEVAELRNFLDKLARAGHLAKVEKLVDTRFEVAAILKKAEAENGPAIRFDNVKGYHLPIVSGLYSSETRTAMAITANTRQDIPKRINEGITHPIPPVKVEAGPVKERVQTEDIDLLRDFPIPIQAEKDIGPYVTAGVVIAKDPNSGRRNLSYHRMQVKGKNRLAICLDPYGHLSDFYGKQEEQNKPLEVAICIGPEPAVEIAAALRVPGDEMEIAGGLRMKPIGLVECETVELQVPGESEILFEGNILPKIREKEGPIFDIVGGYSSGEAPIVEISCILSRELPIYRTILSGSMEHSRLYTLGYEARLWRLLAEICPGVQAVHLPPYSPGFLAVLAVRREMIGEAKRALLATLAIVPNCKIALALEDHIDLYDPREVIRAVSNNLKSPNQLCTLPGIQGYRKEPTSLDIGSVTKLGIDATRPPEDKAETGRIPGVDLVDLSRLLRKLP
jgi:2,5-furandicarboxylate decarboxylase 1